MHLYDRIEEYSFSHNSHFDAATGQYSLLLPHDLNRPLTHDEMDYNLLYHKQTHLGYKIFGSGVDQTLDFTEDVDKVMKFHKIQASDENYTSYINAGYTEGQFIWIMVEMAAAAQPTYVSLSANPSIVNETSNNIVTFTLNTVNIEDATTVGYTITGTNITAPDFIGGLTGIATINLNTATFDVEINADHFTESGETFTLTLDIVDSANNDTTTMSQDANGNGGVPLSADVTITDSSFTPRYLSISGPSSISEGQVANYTVNGQYFYQSATIDWAIDFDNSSATPADFTGSVAGQVFMSAGGSGSFSVEVASDVLSDAGESFTVKLVGLDDNGIDGEDKSKTTNINSVAFPAYSGFGASSNTVTEATPVTFTLGGNNLTNGKTVAYTISGPPAFTAADINVPLTGTITMSGGTGTLTITPTEDNTIEANETITVTLAQQDSDGNQTGLVPTLSASTTIQDDGPAFDLSRTPSSIQEHINNQNEFVVTLNTHNVPMGAEIPYTLGGQFAQADLEVVGETIGGVQSTPTSATQASNGYQGIFKVAPHPGGNFTTSNGGTATGQAKIRIRPLYDELWSEGSETVSVTLAATDDGGLSTGGDAVNMTIQAATQQWQITSSSTQAEPETLTFTLKTKNVAAGTGYTWEAVPYGGNPADGADFGGVLPSGSGTIPAHNPTLANSDTFTTSVIADNTTEGSETYKIEVKENGNNSVKASKNITITDNSQTPAALTYFFHLGAGGGGFNYPFLQDLTGSPLYVATTMAQSTSNPEFIEVFEDALANPGLYEPISTVQLTAGTQIVFPASAAQNYGWMLIPDSAGVPDLTVEAKLFDPNGIPSPQYCSAKLAMTVQGAPHVLYRMPGNPTTGSFTLEYTG